MSRIVLSTPPFTMEELYGELAKSGNTMPSLGLCSLAAVLKKQGHEIKIIEPIALGIDFSQTIREILDFNPRYTGITAPTILIHQAARLARELKKANGEITIILGGAHITALPVETMSDFPEFDIGCIGEGEDTILELITALESGSDLKKVQGITIREEGKVLVTPPRPFIQELDKLPFPAWEFLKGFPDLYRPPSHTYQRLPAATLFTSRGCPYQCVFCDTSVFGRRYRYHSAGYVFRMADKLYHSYGVKEIIFYDDAITTNKQRLVELCGMLKESGMKIGWSCFSRVNDADKDVLRIMKEAGCWQIGYGIESGSQQILDVLKKKITLDQIRSALCWTKEAGISTKGFFMIGNFLETKETIRQTIDFAKGLALDDFQITNLTPFPGSVSFNIAENYGAFDKDWKKMNTLKVCFIPKDLTPEDLQGGQRKAYLEFYIRPRIIAGKIKEIFRNPVVSLNRIYRGLHSLLGIFLSRYRKH